VKLPTAEELDDAARVVYRVLQPTPQIAWPLLAERAGAEVWVKHENHLPTGSFKVRGGLVYVDHLLQSGAKPAGVIAATRGNHGQSVAFVASRARLGAVIVVPHGNNPEKNASMRACGAELIEHGRDFQDAYEFAQAEAERRRLAFFPSFDPHLVRGVATYARELFGAVTDIDTIYVPIGFGSGACGVIAEREARRLNTKIVGVVAANAPTYALSVEAGQPVPTESADTIADGLAVRVPHPDSLEIVARYVERMVSVSDDEIRAAIREYYEDTHNVAEGAGAAALAALWRERERMRGKRVALVLSGCNIERRLFAEILAGD
jgi:threonine dehydratase